MSALEWDHNAYYQRLLLRHLPDRCALVLDVGCGDGAFAARLAERAEHVDALDRSPVMIEQASGRVPANVTLIHADILTAPLPYGHYDAIVSISALHHMALREVLPRLAAALRPGGVLAVVALPRTDLPRELPVELAAGLGHRLLGAAFAVLRASGRGTGRRGTGRRGSWFAMAPGRGEMPVVLRPPLTTAQVRREATALLPGARVRRRLFWRYSLLWQKPDLALG